MLRLAILAVIFLPSILAALSREVMASTLIAAGNTGTLEKTFKKYEKEQDEYELSCALADVAKIQGHLPKVATCLRMVRDPFPKDKSRVSRLVHSTLFDISINTNTESFANAVISFKPSDVKPLASIRYWTLNRGDMVNVLKNVMKNSPELITDDLPSWIAFHSLDRNSDAFNTLALEESFEYLTSLATQSVLEEALIILKRNEHHKVDSRVVCCDSQDHIPQDLSNKLEGLLKLVKVGKALVNELAILPKVLVDIVLDYAPN